MTAPASRAGEVEAGEVIRVELALKDGYRFEVDLGEPGGLDFEVDEFPPLGEGRGPNPARLLATSVAHCLSASLLFCLRKARIDAMGLRAVAEVTLARNERNRLRVGAIRVRLMPVVTPTDRERMRRCLEVFQDYCIVTESIRGGIPVEVAVSASGDLHTESATASLA
jgi:organic hydroperoxide reductase OsmC/OhrA